MVSGSNKKIPAMETKVVIGGVGVEFSTGVWCEGLVGGGEG